MGTWGTGIFSNDLAADVRGDFRDLVGEGLSAEDATRRLLEEYQPSDAADGPLFWTALASTQWQLGRLVDTVRERAVSIIDAGADLPRWEAESSPAEVRKRRAALVELRAKLLSPAPAPKRVAKRFTEETPYAPGDVVAYSLRSGRAALLAVTDIHADKGGRAPIVVILRWTDPAHPSASELAKISPWIPGRGTYELTFGKRAIRAQARTRNILARWSARDDPYPRLRVVGHDIAVQLPNTSDLADPNSATGVIWWRDLDNYLSVVYGLT